MEDLQRVVNKRTKAERVLALLVESGVFYIFSGVRIIICLLNKRIANSSQSMLVASSLIRLPGSHMLGNIYSQAAVHLAVSGASEARIGTN